MRQGAPPLPPGRRLGFDVDVSPGRDGVREQDWFTVTSADLPPTWTRGSTAVIMNPPFEGSAAVDFSLLGALGAPVGVARGHSWCRPAARVRRAGHAV